MNSTLFFLNNLAEIVNKFRRVTDHWGVKTGLSTASSERDARMSLGELPHQAATVNHPPQIVYQFNASVGFVQIGDNSTVHQVALS